MTVSELINKLQQFDQNVLVVSLDRDGDFTKIREVLISTLKTKDDALGCGLGSNYEVFRKDPVVLLR